MVDQYADQEIGADVNQGPSYESGGRLGRTALAAICDQAASSLANYVVLFVAVRTLSIEELGLLTFAYTFALIILIAVRGLVQEPLVIRFTISESARRQRASSSATGAALLIGLGILVLTLIGSRFVNGSTQAAAEGLALAIPALLLQDAYRYQLFTRRSPWAVSVNDATCLGFTVLLLLLSVEVLGSPGITTLLACWAGGRLGGAAIGLLQTRAPPHPLHAMAWLSANRDIGPALAAERATEVSASQFAYLLVGALSGAAALGRLGVTLAVMAPATTMTASLASFGLPEAVRVRDRKPALTALAIVLALLIAAAVLGYTATLLLGPDRLGQFLAGKHWDEAGGLVLPVSVWMAAAGARWGPSVALRALGRARKLLGLSVATAVTLVPVTTFGCLVGGVRGAAWAFAAVFLGSNALYWFAYLHTVGHVTPNAVSQGGNSNRVQAPKQGPITSAANNLGPPSPTRLE